MNAQKTLITGEQLLPLPLVELKVGFGYNKIYELMKRGQFPKNRNIFGKKVWRSSEIDEWIEQQWQTQIENEMEKAG
jgi:predicted DNA-binding transcriptional regulator AlpA